MEARSRVLTIALAATLLTGALLGTQAAADSLAPEPLGGQGQIVGRAGFAYVTTLRRFAAAVLWNRLESQFHEYYAVPLEQQTFMLPNTRVITALDPSLIQPYYVAPWILYRRGRLDEAFALAKEGARNNPDSGLLHSSLSQFYEIEGRLSEAVVEADAAVAAADWLDATEEWEGLARVRAVYERAGETTKSAALQPRLDGLDREIDGQEPEVPHDHDGDGHADH